MATIHYKNPRVLIILLISGILFFVMTCISIAASYYNTIQAVRLSVANQSMKAATSVAGNLDVATYQAFLAHPVKENAAYEQIKKQLEDMRDQLGVLHLYTLRVDDDNQGAKVMIGAFPPDSKVESTIGDPCHVYPEQIVSIMNGQTYYSAIIHDPLFGVYMSAGAPLHDSNGKVIGIIGVDTDMEQVDGIGSEVVRRSVPIFIFQGIFVIVLVLVILGLQCWYRRELRKVIGETEETYQDELRSVISSMRSIRHDFVNHMQVLYGLIECGYFDKARDYVQSLMKETKLLDLTVRIGNPALMVLFHTKWEQAKSRKIVMQFAECPDTFEQIPSIDLIKILSNLIDNAIDAAAVSSGEKRISIACRKEKKKYVFEVENTGQEILPEQREQLFVNGYSTKESTGDAQRGTGLYIVNDVVHKHKGTIEIESNQGVTRFTVHLPVK
ncbi:ATP-binding protein [Brevibacillus reuszeri]|uniref:ATP-binding protein n=1 Tax=Brevibacillus reuszeri TaxID=54915 RepID=UPI00289786A9|nr:ATP-binding protein [Brevibacillus reuszeri]